MGVYCVQEVWACVCVWVCNKCMGMYCVQEVGPCSLSYDLINPRTLYLYDNQSDCAVRDLIGYEANATR